MGNSLIIIDGKTSSILFEKAEVIGDLFGYTFRSEYGHFSDHNEQDIILFFSSNDVCGIVLLETINYVTFSFQTGCELFEEVVDLDGDGFDDYIASDTDGNYVIVNLKSSLETNTKIQNQKTLKPNAMEGKIENLVFGNFTGDNFVDYSFTHLSSSGSETFHYIISGFDNSIVTNITFSEEINRPQTINLDASGLDEIVMFVGTQGRLVALNATGDSYPYNQFQLGSTPDNSQLIPDLDGDLVPEIILSYKLGVILVVSGASGILTTISPIASSLKNSISIENEISIAFVNNTSVFAIQKSIKEYRAYTLIDGSEEQFSTPWRQNDLSSNITFNEKSYNLIFYNLVLNQDIDKDGLSSLDEFYLGTSDTIVDSDEDNLSDLEEIGYGTNPINKDTDYDLIPDEYEVKQHLNPTYNDANGDNDKDNLTNFEEFREGLDPFNWDSDYDGMPDGWEYEYGLYPDISSDIFDSDDDGLFDLEEYLHKTEPNNNDTDGDLILDGWEVDNGLEPTKSEDANLDPDGDGLTNLEEWQNGLDPHNPDQDADGLPDGWEVKYGLDPKDNDDGADIDSDYDLIINRYEYQLGLNPTGRFDALIMFSSLFLIIGSIIYSFVRYNRSNQKAKEIGFENYWHRRRFRKLGFGTIQEKINAEELGFRNAEARNLITGYGMRSLSELIETLSRKVESFRIKYDDQIIEQRISDVIHTKNPLELESLKNVLSNGLEETKHDFNVLVQYIYEIQSVKDLHKQSTISPFISYEEEKIGKVELALRYFQEKINQHGNSLRIALDEREIWFAPWQGLLELIRVTGDNLQVNLAKIIQITDTTETQAEGLITQLLEDNPLLGKYDANRKIYIKGIKVDEYIDFVLKAAEAVDED